MNLQEIKELILKYKKIILIVIVAIGIFAFWSKSQVQTHQNDFNLTEDNTLQEKEKKELSSSNVQNEQTENQKNQEVTCDISGAINNQGVYTLKSGARLDELIQAAGGLKKNAELRAINRAQLLKDQDKIHIPYKGEKTGTANTSSAAGDTNDNTSKSDRSNGEKVNLNTASANDLQKLNGIGAKKAEQIIKYREEKGQFKKIEDLMQVSGIGEKTFAALKEQLEI